jgi:hypothetical protein
MIIQTPKEPMPPEPGNGEGEIQIAQYSDWLKLNPDYTRLIEEQ